MNILQSSPTMYEFTVKDSYEEGDVVYERGVITYSIDQWGGDFIRVAKQKEGGKVEYLKYVLEKEEKPCEHSWTCAVYNYGKAIMQCAKCGEDLTPWVDPVEDKPGTKRFQFGMGYPDLTIMGGELNR